MDTNRKIIDKETISVLDEIIKTAEKFKNAYFWNPPYSAHGRRNMEHKTPMIQSNGLRMAILIQPNTLSDARAVMCTPTVDIRRMEKSPTLPLSETAISDY